VIRAPRSQETDHLVAIGESTGIFGPGEADALLRGTLDALHEGGLGTDHEVRVWADPADDIPAGWVYFAPHDPVERVWQLWWIGVDPARQGQGIGDDLLRFVEQHVARAGGRVLTTETGSLARLERARRFYADRGYTLRDVTSDAYGPGDDKLTFVRTLSGRGPTADAANAAVFLRADTCHLPELGALVEAYYTFDGIAFDAEAVRRGLATLLEDPSLGGAWLIREDGDDPVGYFILTYGFDLEFGGRQATVTELYLRPASRGRGIGRATLSFIEEQLRAAGIGAYELQVERDNATARAFYAAAGFEAHDRIPLSKRVPSRQGLPASETTALAGRRKFETVDHLSLGVNDLEAAKRFYDAALAPLGFSPRTDGQEIGYFLTNDVLHHDDFAFFIGFEDPAAKRPVLPAAGFHIAFRAPTREAVVRFYQAALRAGGRDNGPPGLRPQYHADYFGAFVLDPDGHHIEAVCHLPDGARQIGPTSWPDSFKMVASHAVR
jgi:GNAT superfamily N-acetyltransferase/catechol 2,3-dioxygenase-like lactoylglutathione lyase family enzyme